jgi:hypothetical protein
MAVVTGNLGKKLFVTQRSLLFRVLEGLFLVAKKRGCVAVEFPVRPEEDNNTEIFSIIDWGLVHAECAQTILSQEDIMGTSDLEELALWNNTITVTAKGAVILRFSWARPIQWTAWHAALALKASRMVCALVENCS